MPQAPGRLLGGAIPAIGGIGGGLVAGPPGAAIATGAGVAVENMLEDLLGRQQETSAQQLLSAGKQAGGAFLGQHAAIRVRAIAEIPAPCDLPA